MNTLARRFSSLAVPLIALDLAGCGGEWSGNGPATGGGGTGGGPAGSRSALYTAVDNELLGFSGTDYETENNRLLALLKTKPEVVESGIDDSGVVWGHFADGTNVAVCNNLNVNFPSSLTRSPTNFRAPTRELDTGLPGTARVMVGSTVGPIYSNWTQGIRNMLGRQKYFVDSDATVDALKNMQKVSVLYILGHGGVLRGSTYGVWTETKVTDQLNRDYAADISDGSLMVMWGETFPGTETGPFDENKHYYEKHYAITANFVKKYWRGKFDANSLVFMNCCNSSSDGALAFQGAFLDAGASIYLGWDHRMVLGDAFTTGAYLFDRLLGANPDNPLNTNIAGLTIPKETPPQRAFSFQNVIAEMGTRMRAGGHYAFDTTVDYPHKKGDVQMVTKLKMLSLNFNFGQLAPAIEFATPDEQKDELHVTGTFGTVKGVVKLGTGNLKIKSWAPDEVICELPRDGTGDVQVQVGKTGSTQKSNIVQLTSWRGAMTLTNTGAGSLKMVVHVNLHFREDVVGERSEPHGEVFEADGAFQHALDSSGDYEFSGKFVSPADASGGHWEESWSGAGSLPAYVTQPPGGAAPPASAITFSGGFQPNRHWRLDMQAEIVKGKHVRMVHFNKNGGVDQDTTTDHDALWFSTGDPNGSPYLQVVPETYSIGPGQWTFVNGPTDVRTMAWGAIGAVSSPTADAARSAVLTRRH